MEKANNMMTDNDMMCWHALYTAPKSEHKLMQRLNAAGYTTYCPMQAVFVKWKGHTRKVITPLFSGCLFVLVMWRKLPHWLPRRRLLYY